VGAKTALTQAGNVDVMAMKRHRALFAALALLAEAAPNESLGDPRPDYFLHGYYVPASGRVGQFFHADAAFGVDDMPGNCVPEFSDMVISGALPPGLDVANSTSSVIAGTPKQAGNWPVLVTFHALGCSYDIKDRVDRSIKVVFHIAP
jgi:hypothetical protein